MRPMHKENKLREKVAIYGKKIEENGSIQRRILRNGFGRVTTI